MYKKNKCVALFMMNNNNNNYSLKSLLKYQHHVYLLQSVHQALAVCVAVWAAVKARERASEMGSVSAIRDTQATCVRAAPTATTEKKAPTTARAPAPVRPTHTPV